MRFFIAGVMQGSSHGTELHDQDYRERIEATIRRAMPTAEVYDPWANHRESITYDDLTGTQVFLEHNRMCEMWEAFRNDRMVIAISPMAHNWAIKFVSHLRFDSLDDFDRAMEDGSLPRRIAAFRRS